MVTSVPLRERSVGYAVTSTSSIVAALKVNVSPRGSVAAIQTEDTFLPCESRYAFTVYPRLSRSAYRLLKTSQDRSLRPFDPAITWKTLRRANLQSRVYPGGDFRAGRSPSLNPMLFHRLLLLCLSALGTALAAPSVLHYRAPAANWNESLPVGNGRLGAMLFGTVDREHLSLNEDSIWSGEYHFTSAPQMRVALPEVRRLLFAGDYRTAHELAEKTFTTPNDPRYGHFQPLADLWLSFPSAVGTPAGSYRRELNIDEAIATTRFNQDGVHYTRTIFASAPAEAIVVRIEANKPGSITGAIELTRGRDANVRSEAPARIVLTGVTPFGGVKFATVLEARTEGGSLRIDGSRLQMQGADALVLVVTAQSTFRHADPLSVALVQARAAVQQPWDELRAAHIADYQRFFRRVTIDLGSEMKPTVPTNERLLGIRSGQDDPALAALFFQFGRYLLISSSRPGTLPANLQGLWNESYRPPWFGDYTININTEMNYWPAEPTGLAELNEPLFDLIERLRPAGRLAARDRYGCRGWVLSTRTAPWATSELRGTADLLFNDAAAWLSLHLWDHYLFAPDRKFLAERAYPILRESAEFYLDFLVPHPSKSWLVAGPAGSPENKFMAPDGSIAALSMGPTMSHQIVRELFQACLAAGEILGGDEIFRAEVKVHLDKLAPMQIGRRGQLQEWLEDFEEVEPQHRHVSHLFGLHPGTQISPHTTPDLATAARRSLELRGDGGTGWSKAWKINFWARLRDGDRAHKLLNELLAHSTLPNLLDTHPPFQIDGNFGATAGIAEMLLQSHLGEIELLPALPKSWPNGRVSGLRARGGATVDLAWAEGRLEGATVRATHPGTFRIRHGTTVREITLARGEAYQWK